MGPYRDPQAALVVGQTISAHLSKSAISLEQLAKRLELKRAAKIINLATGRHYFPLEQAKLAAEILGIDAPKFLRLVLLQYHPMKGVNEAFEVISAHALEGRKQASGPGKTKRKEKKKKKFRPAGRGSDDSATID
jgi:hypothetical protein